MHRLLLVACQRMATQLFALYMTAALYTSAGDSKA